MQAALSKQATELVQLVEQELAQGAQSQASATAKPLLRLRPHCWRARTRSLGAKQLDQQRHWLILRHLCMQAALSKQAAESQQLVEQLQERSHKASAQLPLKCTVEPLLSSRLNADTRVRTQTNATTG